MRATRLVPITAHSKQMMNTKIPVFFTDVFKTIAPPMAKRAIDQIKKGSIYDRKAKSGPILLFGKTKAALVEIEEKFSAGLNATMTLRKVLPSIVGR